MAGDLRVAVIGSGRWAKWAHLPGWTRDKRCKLVAVCDTDPAVAQAAADQFGIPSVSTDFRELLDRNDIDIVDIVTRDSEHFDITWSALQAGKHVLVEKPVAHDFRDTLRARDLARSKGLKTKVGFTFRYAPAMIYMKELIDAGYVGTPFIYNGYEQNSQFIDPATPLRGSGPAADQTRLKTASLEGYGAPIIDLGHWFVGSDLTSVVGTLRNFVPLRFHAATGRQERTNIDDGDIFLGEFANGTICSIQSSFVTVGNYPGLEARLYGSEGALICRLVEEFGICESLKGARPDHVEFKDIAVPERLYPEGGSSRENWATLFYSNLTASFAGEILSGGEANQGNFEDAAWVQEVINAVELSHHQRRWINLPLSR